MDNEEEFEDCTKDLRERNMLSQQEKITLIGKTIGKDCLCKRINTRKKLSECIIQSAQNKI